MLFMQLCVGAFYGSQRPVVRLSSGRYLSASMVKAKVGAYVPYWPQKSFEINSFRADLSVGLLDLRCVLG